MEPREPRAPVVEQPTEHGEPIPDAVGPYELLVQERDAFAEFTAHIDEKDERRPETESERAEMDARLEQLGDLFAGAPVRWHLDGAQNISLLNMSLRGEGYIGVHKDVDVSVERDELEQLEIALREKGYAFMLSYKKDPTDARSPGFMRRIGGRAAATHEDAREHLMIVRIDEHGRIREDEGSQYPLNFLDVHIVDRNAGGKPVGFGGAELPDAWFTPQPQEFHGRTINRSHPAKVAYYKLFQERAYDRTDCKKLMETGALTTDDVETIAAKVEEGIAGRIAKANAIVSRACERIAPDSNAEAIANAFLSDPEIAGRRAVYTEQIRAFAERVAAGECSPERIQWLFAETFLANADAVHAEWRRRVANLREWFTAYHESERVRRELRNLESPNE